MGAQVSCRKWDTGEAKNGDMVTHNCHPSIQELRREDLELGILNYIVSLRIAWAI